MLQVFMSRVTRHKIVEPKSRRRGIDGIHNRRGVRSAEPPDEKIACFPGVEHPIEEVFGLFALTEGMAEFREDLGSCFPHGATP
jgi:hypothetical protein